jgi:tetratricopeptide (TPR) repeat protein
MNLFIFFFSGLGLISLFFKRYLAVSRGIDLFDVIKRYFKRVFKMPSKHAIIAQNLAAEQKAEETTNLSTQSEQSKTPPLENAEEMEKATQIYNKADYLAGRGEIDEAKKLLIQTLSINENHEEANHKLGTIYIQEGNFSKAEIIYSDLCLKFNDNPKYFSHLGLSLFHQNKLPQSKEAYQKALELEPDKISRYLNLARIYEEMDDQVFALRHFQEARAKDPRSIEALIAFSEYFVRRDQKEGARELLEEVLRISPRNEYAAKLMRDLI